MGNGRPSTIKLEGERMEIFKTLYNQGMPYERIAFELNVNPSNLAYWTRKQVDQGLLPPREQKQLREKQVKIRKEVLRQVVTHKGEVCNEKFCKSCKYHFNDANKYLCNYADLTGKTRVNKDNNAFKGNMWECREYQPYDKRKSRVKAPKI